MKYIPHNYQKRAIEFILSHNSAALFLDMGLGKTSITLSSVKQLIEEGKTRKVLVIAPKKVAEGAWNAEADKWDDFKSLRLERLTGTVKQRQAALKRQADIYIIGRDNVSWLVENYSWDFDTLVIDELSSFKNPQSKRFKSLKKILSKTNRIIGLTGTPSANGLMDLWSEIYLLDRGERLGRTLTQYRNTYFRPGKSNGCVVYEWIPLQNAQERIEEKIGDICLSMSAADYLTLPPCIYNTVKVRMTQKEKKLYDQMKREQVLMLDDDAVFAANAAAVLNKLLQMANGRVYSDSGVFELHSQKLERLKEMVYDANEPVLIFYNFRHDIDAIRSVIPDVRTLNTENDVKEWNEGRIKVLLAHPASVGYGLNLQSGGRIIIWYGLTWSLEQYQQANARLYRQGQTKPVIIHHLITEGTADELVLKALENKNVNQKELLNALK